MQRDLDSNGVGLFDLWTVRFPCGLEVALWSFHMSHSMEVPAEEPRGVEVYANEADGAHVLAHLPFRIPTASIWFPERSETPELPWIVMRQDESGTRFPIKRCSSRCEAELEVQEFELRGHKQHYWFESVSASRGAHG
jgi:hypothetical protein